MAESMGFIMSSRLSQLKRQKLLLEEHLLWLEEEIVAESGQFDQSAAPVSVKVAKITEPSKVIPAEKQEVQTAAKESEPTNDDIEELSDHLISQYGTESYRKEMDPRLALVLFFGGALGLLSVVVFAFYWFGYR